MTGSSLGFPAVWLRHNCPCPECLDPVTGQRLIEVTAIQHVCAVTVEAQTAQSVTVVFAPDGRRLVYGGHTIGLVCSQICRALPNLVTIVAWHSCDHLGPVHEGDTLRTRIELERCDPLPGGGGIVHLRARAGGEGTDVLDWRLAAVMA